MAFQAVAIAANTVVAQVPTVNDSEFNPLAQTSRVTLFGASSVIGTGGRGAMVSMKLGTDVQCTDFILPISTGGAVSTRDHQVATGVAARGSKITVSYRNEGTATPTINGYVIIEPL